MCMVYLHSLLKINSETSKRRGRGLGSGRGSKSGRGTTRHQAARTSIPLGFEGGQGKLVKRFPLLRGKSKNKTAKSGVYSIRLSKIAKLDGVDVINRDVLIEKSVVPSDAKYVKVVFDAKVEKSLKIQLPVTKQVAQAVKDAGGSIEA